MNINAVSQGISKRYSSLLNFFYSSTYQEEVDKKLHEHILGLNKKLISNTSNNESIYQALVSQVKSEGYVILPSVFSGKVLESIQSEFKEIIGSSATTHHQVDRKGDTTCVRVNHHEKHDLKLYPATAAFFNSQALKEITKMYFEESKNGFDFNTEIFVHETHETDNPLSGAMHWDRAQTLKFWVYIDDIPLEAGPMRVEKGTVEKNKQIRLKAHVNKEVLIGGIDNVLEVDEKNVAALVAPAGSVIIHDTDGTHGASQVKPGHVRKIMRGHCRARQ